MKGGQVGTLAAMALARVAFGYQMQTVASLGPALRGEFGIEFAVLGTLMGLYQFPGVPVAIPCGFLARRFGDLAVIAGGMGLMVAGAVVSAMAGGPFGIGVGRVVAGVGAVSLTVLQPKAVADRFTGVGFNIAMSVLIGSFPIGIGLGQLTQGRLAEAHGWQWAFLAGGVLAAGATAVLLATWRRAEGEVPRSLAWPSRREAGLCALAGLIWTAFNAGYFNFLGFLPSLLVAHGHPTWMADVVLTLATWGNLPVMLLGGAVAARFGVMPVFVFGAVMLAVSVAGMGLVDWPLIWGALFGTVASVHAGIIVGWGALSAKPENRAVGMGIFYVVYYVGSTLTPVLCGHAADWVGDPSGAFVCAGVLSAVALPAGLWHRAASMRD